jgi:hypothetical protein
VVDWLGEFIRCMVVWACVNGKRQGQRPGGCGIRDVWFTITIGAGLWNLEEAGRVWLGFFSASYWAVYSTISVP